MKTVHLAVIASLIAAPVSFAAAPDSGGKMAAPGPVVGGTLLGVQVEEIAEIATGYRASKLLHEAVYNDQKQKIGKVEDFIVKADGKLSYVIVDVGGFLGMGVHRVAIPLSQITGVKPHVMLPGATKEALKAMPQFDYAK